MRNKTILITGATSGIGKAAAISLAKKNFKIIIHGRDREKTLQTVEEIKLISGNENIDMIIADMSSMNEVRRMAAEFKRKHDVLDVLINNAGGIMSKERQVTIDGFEKTMAVNLFAPFLLTGLLLDSLKKSPEARIINVSSSSHKLNAKPNFDDLQLQKYYNPFHAYGNSKLFLIWITECFSAKLKEKGIKNITLSSMHPGAVATNFGVTSNLGSGVNLMAKLIRPFFRSVHDGADTIIYLADEHIPTSDVAYYVDRKKTAVSKKYYSKENAEIVWSYCNKITELYL